MKNTFKLLSIFTVIALLTISCRKDDEDNHTATAGFKWREHNQTGAEKTSGSARFQGGNTIFATDSNGKTFFEINLIKGSNPGTYTFDEDYIKGVAIFFVDDNFSAKSGIITITEKTASIISGNFEAIGRGNSISKIYATFTDIPIQ